MILRTIESLLKKRNKEKYTSKINKFNEINTQFASTDNLSENERKLLHILETRSEINNGDTKITTKRIMKLFEGKCYKTIQRYLKKLEDKGYIRRLTVPYFAFGGNYADRTIRCLRIFLKNRFKFKPDLKWKRDFRPSFNVAKTVDISTGKKIESKWYIPSGSKFNDSSGKVYEPAWNDVYELYSMNIIDPQQVDMAIYAQEGFEIGSEDPFIVTVLGKRFLKGAN